VQRRSRKVRRAQRGQRPTRRTRVTAWGPRCGRSRGKCLQDATWRTRPTEGASAPSGGRSVRWSLQGSWNPQYVWW
jgi:hypothetical protein